jgi:hypothetical protein
MSISIPLPAFKGDLKAHLERLELFIAELEVLKTLTFKRYHFLVDQIENDKKKLIDKNIPPPVFSMHQFYGSYADIEANLYTKCYFVVFRQAIERLLKVIYLMKSHLEPADVKHSICDGSNSRNFTRFIENVVAGVYQYDAEVLNIIDVHRDMFIVSRVIRNSLKTQGTVKVVIIDKKVSIRCPIQSRERADRTLNLLKTPLSVEIKNLKNFTMDPEFLDQILESLKGITKVLKLKYASKINDERPATDRADSHGGNRLAEH